MGLPSCFRAGHWPDDLEKLIRKIDTTGNYSPTLMEFFNATLSEVIISPELRHENVLGHFALSHFGLSDPRTPRTVWIGMSVRAGSSANPIGLTAPEHVLPILIHESIHCAINELVAQGAIPQSCEMNERWPNIGGIVLYDLLQLMFVGYVSSTYGSDFARAQLASQNALYLRPPDFRGMIDPNCDSVIVAQLPGIVRAAIP